MCSLLAVLSSSSTGTCRGHQQAMFWARRGPERASLANEHVQTTIVEAQGTAERNKNEKVSKEDNADCSEKKYIASLSRLEKKVQCHNRKYSAALSKLEKKVQHYKENKNLASYFDGSFHDRRRNPLYGTHSLPSLMSVSSVHENNIGENSAPLACSVNHLSCHEQDIHSESQSVCVKKTVSPSSNIASKFLDTPSIKTQYTLSAQDVHSVNCIASAENGGGSESKFSGEPCNNEKDVIIREMYNDESSSDSSNQRLGEDVLLEERINSDLIKVFQCNFCSTYYLYYESYQEHKKKCLSCSKCDLTFSSIFELYKHVTSKAHKEYFSFLQVCKWTQSQLKLHMSRNEVHKSDVEKLALLRLASQEKELSVLLADSNIGKSLSSSDKKQDNIGANSLPCVSVCSDPVASAQEKNESLTTSQCMIENKTHSKIGEVISSPANSMETRKLVEQNDNEIVCIKKLKTNDCTERPSNGNINTNITNSLSKQPSDDKIQQNRHFPHMLPQTGRIGKKFGNRNIDKNVYSEKNLNNAASESLNDLSKSLQKTSKDCKPPQNKSSSRTTEKSSYDNKPEKICSKVQPLQIVQSGSASVQIDGRIITSKSPNKKRKESQDKVPQIQKSSKKKPHREQSSCRAPKSKITSKDLLQMTRSNSSNKLGKASPRKTQEEVHKQIVVSSESEIYPSSDSLTFSTSFDKENSISKNVNSSSSSQVITGNQTKRTNKRSHSFEESAPKAIKLLMKTVQVASDFVLSCRKLDKVPKSCPGCSSRIDNTTAVYNTKTNHVSFWCRSCNCDIVFSAVT